MIIITVQLFSARDKSMTELGRMMIANDGTGSEALGNYNVQTFRGRGMDALNKMIGQRHAKVSGFPRKSTHVWNLVARALKAMRYE